MQQYCLGRDVRRRDMERSSRSKMRPSLVWRSCPRRSVRVQRFRGTPLSHQKASSGKPSGPISKNQTTRPAQPHVQRSQKEARTRLPASREGHGPRRDLCAIVSVGLWSVFAQMTKTADLRHQAQWLPSGDEAFTRNATERTLTW